MTNKSSAALVIVGNAFIWAAAMISAALLLQDTPRVWPKLAPVLGGAAAASFFLNVLAARSVEQAQPPADNPLKPDRPSPDS
jgi:hypothetical protein